jgi:hypothetical protein
MFEIESLSNQIYPIMINILLDIKIQNPTATTSQLTRIACDLIEKIDNYPPLNNELTHSEDNNSSQSISHNFVGGQPFNLMHVLSGQVGYGQNSTKQIRYEVYKILMSMIYCHPYSHVKILKLLLTSK